MMPFAIVVLLEVFTEGRSLPRSPTCAPFPKGAIRATIFEPATEMGIEIHAEKWKDGGKSAAQWRASLRDYSILRVSSLDYSPGQPTARRPMRGRQLSAPSPACELRHRPWRERCGSRAQSGTQTPARPISVGSVRIPEKRIQPCLDSWTALSDQGPGLQRLPSSRTRMTTRGPGNVPLSDGPFWPLVCCRAVSDCPRRLQRGQLTIGHPELRSACAPLLLARNTLGCPPESECRLGSPRKSYRSGIAHH